MAGNGGPAFPRPLSWDLPPPHAEQAGMSLRDYFAAHAPFTLTDAVMALDNHNNAPDSATATCRVLMNDDKFVEALRVLAALRGAYADAMIEERK